MGVIQNQVISARDKKWITSRVKTFMQESRSPKPTIKRVWTAISNRRLNKSPSTLKLAVTKMGSRKIKPIKKFIRLLMTDDIGIISRGNIDCFNIGPLIIKELVASMTALLKNSHGIKPANANNVKFSIFILKTMVNIKLIHSARINGVTTAHQMPSLEPAYFALNCKMIKSLKTWRCR